jgi:hypothetical protein
MKSAVVIAFTGLLAVAVSAPASWALDLSWVHSRDEMSALSRLAGAYGQSLMCDELVDAQIAGKFLEDNVKFDLYSPEQAANLMNLVTSTIAAQASMVGKPSKKLCADARKLYGPNGTEIPGFFKTTR